MFDASVFGHVDLMMGKVIAMSYMALGALGDGGKNQIVF